MPITVVQFFAILLTALALVPGGAHLLELPNKMKLDRDAYLVVQRIYRGWSLAGVALMGSLLTILWLAILSWAQPLPLAFSSLAFALMLVTLIAFFLRIYPVNKATAQWTVATENFEQERRQWEYTHAANSVLTFLALGSALAASLTWRHG